jgi:hypothetical protein
LVSGCDDDHCPPGRPREQDQNVTFGIPRHRGVEGGAPCAEALQQLSMATRSVFREHDQMIQALALHCHFAAMHPFLDGNGRTARALEALMLQRVGLRDTLFIAMSNYYYEEKAAYLAALSEARALGHDLTPFLKFALKGIQRQCQRLFAEIRIQLSKALYRNTVADLFGRLKSPRKRVISGRHIQLVNLLLDQGALTLDEVARRSAHLYSVRNPQKALFRDLNYLITLGALSAPFVDDENRFVLTVNLEWPTQITETEFFRRLKMLPKGKVHGFLSK